MSAFLLSPAEVEELTGSPQRRRRAQKPKPPKWIKVDLVAAITGLTPEAILARSEMGTFPCGALRHGYMRWNEAEVDAWIADRDAAQPPTPTCLYRHFDAEGRLLYVGISLSAIERTNTHRQRAYWFREVVTIRVEWFPDRKAAAHAEMVAIRNESPLHNKTGVTP